VALTRRCEVRWAGRGERRGPPRHTGSAVYHVVQGEGETVIDGQRFAWGKGSIIAQPSWAVHEHANTSAKEDAVLFSINDAPVLEALGLYYEEEFTEGGGRQRVASTFSSHP